MGFWKNLEAKKIAFLRRNISAEWLATTDVPASDLSPSSAAYLKHYKAELIIEELQSANFHLRLHNQQLIKDQHLQHSAIDSLTNQVLLAQAQARSVEQRYRSILDVMPHIVWTTDSEGWVNFINERWYEYTGTGRDKPIQSAWGSTVHPDDIESAGERYLQIIAGNTGGEFEARTPGDEGTYRWYLTRMQPIRDTSGAPLFWVGTATDIDDLKKRQQQKDDFLNIASHELKTPLSSLKAAIQLLAERQHIQAELRSKLIIRAGKSLDKVVDLIDDLMDMGTINQGLFKLNKTRFSPTLLMRDFAAELKNAGHYTLEFSGDTDLYVLGDFRRIEQVLLNLANNAMRHAPKSALIKLDIRRQADTVKISLIDQGPGIDPELALHLFDRYFQAGHRNFETTGMGLGLYISSQIIGQHGQTLQVESELGRGTCFWFILPLAPDPSLATTVIPSEFPLPELVPYTVTDSLS